MRTFASQQQLGFDKIKQRTLYVGRASCMALVVLRMKSEESLSFQI